MSRVSTRYAPHILGLLALVSFPAYFHATGRSHQDDCANPSALVDGFDWGTTHPVEQIEANTNRNKIQWTEGKIDIDPAGERQLEFTVARSFRPATLFMSFDKLRPGFIEPEEIKVRELSIDGDDVNVHVLIARDDMPVKLAAYMTIYEHEASANLFVTQLGTAVQDLFSTLSPMTLYFLYAQVGHQGIDAAEERAVEWLSDAWRQYRAACVP